MSHYNNTNTIVLEKHMQEDGNLRMLLVHRLDDVPADWEQKYKREYVIGSYFREECSHLTGSVGYSWDWGHYFNDIEAAYCYWKRVKGGEA